MGILVDHKTKVICQGILSPQGLSHIEQALAYGTNVVGGVAKDKTSDMVLGIPLFATVKEAVEATHPDATVIFSSPEEAYEEIIQASRAEIPLLVCPTERMPVHDMLKIKVALKKSKSRLIGPASHGILTTKECKLGTIPAHLFTEGPVGIMSRSSSVMYEAIGQLQQKGLGVSSCVVIGAYPVLGTTFEDIMDLFQKDKKTKVVLMIGEIGGDFEQKLAVHYQKMKRKKPLISYVIGTYVPEKTYMGNIGAIVSDKNETAVAKKEALRQVGSVIVDSPAKIGDAVFKTLTSLG